jgi:hypothetical protein
MTMPLGAIRLFWPEKNEIRLDIVIMNTYTKCKNTICPCGASFAVFHTIRVIDKKILRALYVQYSINGVHVMSYELLVGSDTYCATCDPVSYKFAD